MLRRPGIGTPGPDDKPRDLKLCFLYRADDAAGNADLVAEMIDGVAAQSSRERESDGGIRDTRATAFTVEGRRAAREPLEAWFTVTPAQAYFSAESTPGFAEKLLLAVRKWSTRTFFLDLKEAAVENWSQRREENTRVLLDRAKDLVRFAPVPLQGAFIPQEEIAAKRAEWKAHVTAAFDALLADLRAKHPGKFALLTPSSYTDADAVHGFPGSTVVGIYDTEEALEQAAQDYWHLCYLLNIRTGDYWSRWASR